MNELKYLGKPAPFPKGREDWSQTYQRNQHLEKAIKEAIELLLAPYDEWPDKTFNEIYTKKGYRRIDALAFLLRHTIGERT